jgi:L,D-transpeptidase catalytic domain
MRRALFLLALGIPVALAAVPVTLAGADPSTDLSRPSLVRSDAPPSGSARVERAVRAAARAASAALMDARRLPPAKLLRIRPGGTAALRTRPSGAIALRLDDTTEFGSPRTLGVVRRRGDWLGVTTAELPNGRLGWVRAGDDALAVRRTRWSIHADVSSRRIVLKRDGIPVRRLAVAVGRPGSPTPTGRFAVTDKISGSRFGPYYGCCILAISATQPNLPPGWTGGDRMAIHGTSDPGSIGVAASAGCLRAADGDLRLLMDRVPLGAPVVIRP